MGKYSIDLSKSLVNVVMDSEGQTVKENGLQSIARQLVICEKFLDHELDGEIYTHETREGFRVKENTIIRTLEMLGYKVYFDYPGEDTVICIRRN